MDEDRARPARRWRRPRRPSRCPTSSKLRPVSSRQLPSPLDRGSSTPSRRDAAGPVDRLAVEHRPAPVLEVAAHERAVVVVARRRPSGRGPRRRRRASPARTPPSSCPRRCRRRRRRPPSHRRRRAIARATASMPMLSCRSETSATTVSPLPRLPQVEAGRLLGSGAVELLALVVGVDRALDQPPGLRGGDVAADLDALRLLGQRRPRRRGTRPAASTTGRTRTLFSSAVPRLPQQDPERVRRPAPPQHPGGPRARTAQLAPTPGPEQQPDQRPAAGRGRRRAAAAARAMSTSASLTLATWPSGWLAM